MGVGPLVVAQSRPENTDFTEDVWRQWKVLSPKGPERSLGLVSGGFAGNGRTDHGKLSISMFFEPLITTKTSTTCKINTCPRNNEK